MDIGVIEKINVWQELGLAVAVATIVETSGSTPRKAGASLALAENGEWTGTVGGGSGEWQVMELARQVLVRSEPAEIEIRMNNYDAAAAGMICGGTMRVFVNYLPSVSR
ncbi:MAG: XdhC family protein [Negativicutes bacterium]|nr:XdhC family protein [Negativicutes bacterium]